MEYPSLDAHAHIRAQGISSKPAETGAVLGMSLSLEEAGFVARKNTDWITWGPGCHPRFAQAQEHFDGARFKELVQNSAIVGEVGLDTGSRVPVEQQLIVFRQILEIVAEMPRFTSIHSYRANALVLEELRRTPIKFPVLHWWTGSADETSQAVELGCFFSVHSQVARQSKFRTRVPLERILVESDHGYEDPPAAIPCRIKWVEYLVAQQYKMDVHELRRVAWSNLSRIINATGVQGMLPRVFRTCLQESSREPATILLQGELPNPHRESP